MGGRKFYEMARKGEAVPSLPKKVRVTRLTFGEPAEGRLPFAIACSSGTYIRSIASELGEKLVVRRPPRFVAAHADRHPSASRTP